MKQYEERLRGMLFVPTFSYGRRMLREDVAPNAIRLGFELFFFFLPDTTHHELLHFHF